jgi:hypothetical protein
MDKGMGNSDQFAIHVSQNLLARSISWCSITQQAAVRLGRSDPKIAEIVPLKSLLFLQKKRSFLISIGFLFQGLVSH